MKKLLSTLAIAIFFGMASPSTEARDTLSVDFFYDNLSPHGNWLEVGDYGYCWQPNEMRDDWSPYSDGRWVYTDAGWTWDSREPYGWAVYHYGRWADVRNVGWVWVPGVEWGPAWVSWRHSSSHVGWAPLPPEARFSISIGFNSWVDNYYDIGPSHYRFVEGRNFGSRRLNTVFVDRSQNYTIINQTTNITNITYENNVIHNGGPRYDEVVRQSSEPISRYKLDRRQGIDRSNRRQSAEQLESRVEGDSFSVAALPIEAGPAGKPEKIARRVTDSEVVIDKGWSNAGSADDVSETRKKMQEQAEVPAELPKTPTFVKPTDTEPSPGVLAENPVGNDRGKGKGEPGNEPATPGQPTLPMTPPVTAPGDPAPDQPTRQERPEGRPGMREPTAPLPEIDPTLPPMPRQGEGDNAPRPQMPLPGTPGSRPEGRPSDSQTPRPTDRENTPRPQMPLPGNPETSPEGRPSTDPAPMPTDREKAPRPEMPLPGNPIPRPEGRPSDSREPRTRETQPERTSPQPNLPRPSMRESERQIIPERPAPRAPEVRPEGRNAPVRPPQQEGRMRENTPKVRPQAPPSGGTTEEEPEKGKGRNRN